MAKTQAQATTVRMMTEGGSRRIPADTIQGNLFRPTAQGWPGARTATLETLFDFFINNVPDPDSALIQDPDFDEKLRQQPDVHACMRLRELTVASMPAHFEASDAKDINKDFAQTVADYCDTTFNNLANRNDLYRQMQNAVLMGGQGHEWVWAKDATGVEKPVEFYPIHKNRFVFDRLGNMAILTRETPVWGSYISVNPTRVHGDLRAWPVPGGKFMYHKYMAEGGPWTRPASEGYLYWGRGEDTNLYIPVTFDQFVLRFRMKWLEKHGMPLTILRYPDNEALTTEVLKIAESLRGESVVTIPKMVGAGNDDHFYSIEFVEPPAMGHDAFARFSDEWTKPRVEKILLGGANLMEVGDQGSYGATVAQGDRGAQIVFRWDAKNIDTTINLQIVPYMVQAKWPGCDPRYYPKHMMVPEQEKDRAAEMEVIEAAARIVPVREADVYDRSGLTKPKEDEEKVFLGQEQSSPFDMFPTPVGQKLSDRRAARQPQGSQVPSVRGQQKQRDARERQR